MNTAAVWWRVSTDDQKEISPDTQTGTALALAEQEGYHVAPENIIGTDWGSLSVWDSPPMDRLKALIMGRAITAVFMYDADRGPSKPVHRLLFRALCEEYGVTIRCCHGQIPDGDMGELMEFISAWSKEKQVHRAQQGAKDGLRDRAMIRRLPVTGQAPYGYQLRYELKGATKVPVAFEPTPQAYPIVSRIWELALDGTPIRGICRHLVGHGIPAPKGGTAWNPPTVLRILKNPIYGGRYYALRSEAQEPSRRKGVTHGKSSERRRTPEDWVFLEDFKIESPIVTWPQWEAVQERLRLNKAQARRNAKRTYVLSGMLFCGEDGWRLQVDGRYNRRSHVYLCPHRQRKSLGGPGCSSHQLHGLTVEETVWDQVSQFLSDPHTFMAEMERQRGAHDGGQAGAEKQIKGLETKLRNVDRMETELVGLKLRGQVSDVAFDRQSALLRAERSYYEDEIERQKETLATSKQCNDALASLAEVRAAMIENLDSATPEDRRWVLQSLDTRVTVNGERLEVSIGIPSSVIGGDCVPATLVA